MKSGFRDGKHNDTETVIKSKYENNGYWLWKYYLEYLKDNSIIKDIL